MGLQLVTGQGATDHITSADAGSMHAGIVGEGRYVLNRGNKFAYEVVSNNLVKIKDGDLMNQGRHMIIPVNDYEECTIENGLQSVKRNDLIVARYSKNTETEIESTTMVVIKGVSGDTPTDHAYTTGNILNGDAVDDFPLYRVRLNGLTIEGVDTLFTVNKSLNEVQQTADNLIPISTYSALNNNTSLGKTADAIIVNTFKEDLWAMGGKNFIKYGQDLNLEGLGILHLNDDFSVTINGTFEPQYSSIKIATVLLKKGSYTLTGCMSGATEERLLCKKDNNIIASDSGSGADFTLIENSTIDIYITVKVNYQYDTQHTFYPMIRCSYIKDATYEPYKEFATQKIIGDKYKQHVAYEIGKIRIKDDALYKSTTAGSYNEEWTPSHWTKTSVVAELESIESTLAVKTSTLFPGSTGTITTSMIEKQGMNYRVHGTISGVNLIANQYTVVANVPSGFIPITPYTERKLVGAGIEGYLNIDTNGHVSVYVETARSNVTLYIEVTSMT